MDNSKYTYVLKKKIRFRKFLLKFVQSSKQL